MATSDVIRIRVEPAMKRELMEMYKARGTTVSHAVRGFLEAELRSRKEASGRLDAILSSADEKLTSSALPEPTIDEMVAFVDRVRDQRSVEAALFS